MGGSRNPVSVWIFMSCCLLGDGTLATLFSSDYMTEKCNGHLRDRVSGRLETSTSLTYSNLMDCYTTVSVASDRKILLVYNRFETEDPLLDTCVDVFNVHDGDSTSAQTLNPDPLCGVRPDLTNMTTSGSTVTFHFITDNNAVFRGFDIVYTAIKSPPCDEGEYECNNALCIHGDLRCDNVEQCGDGSDEVGCEDMVDAVMEQDTLPVGIISGSSIAAFVLIVIIVVITYKVYQYYKWRQFVRLHTADLQDDAGLYAYPKTDKYTVLDVGPRGRRQPHLSHDFVNSAPQEVRGKSGKRRKEVTSDSQHLKDMVERYLDEN